MLVFEILGAAFTFLFLAALVAGHDAIRGH